MRTSLLDFRFSIEELSNLLTTKNSPKVPDEDQDGGPVFPERSERHLPAAAIKHIDSV